MADSFLANCNSISQVIETVANCFPCRISVFSSGRSGEDKGEFEYASGSTKSACLNLINTMTTPLTHFDDSGASRMVDVGQKPITQRMARAEATVVMQPETLALIQNREFAKGDVLEVARLAGIMATKRTDELIPLCHSLGLDAANINFEIMGKTDIRIESQVSLQGRTGVEMEAMTAVSIAALTIYDMCKAVDRSMEIMNVRLVEKNGGKSGHFLRE